MTKESPISRLTMGGTYQPMCWCVSQTGRVSFAFLTKIGVERKEMGGS